MAGTAEIEGVQRTLNGFTSKWLRGVAPLHVDGVKGPATNRRIKWVKWYLGWGASPNKNTAKVSHQFLEVCRHPKNWTLYPNAGMYAVGVNRRRREKLDWARNRVRAWVTPGVTTFDGRPVCKCAVPILKWCRAHGWHGVLVSGYRSPAYSDSLCRRICGAPRCPGICAGRSSNHSGNSCARFAVDVSDYWTFRYLAARCPLQPKITNHLPRDPVHLSPSGF